jgi:hypothetical protein
MLGYLRLLENRAYLWRFRGLFFLLLKMVCFSAKKPYFTWFRVGFGLGFLPVSWRFLGQNFICFRLVSVCVLFKIRRFDIDLYAWLLLVLFYLFHR